MHETQISGRNLPLCGYRLGHRCLRWVERWCRARPVQARGPSHADGVAQSDAHAYAETSLRQAPLIGVAAMCVALAACSAAHGATTASSSRCPAVAPVAPPQLLYPVPGSTRASNRIRALVVATYITGGFTTILSGGARRMTTTSVADPTGPLPSPMAAPSLRGTRLVAIEIPQLATKTTYSVTFALPAPFAGCAAPRFAAGSFRTR
jgi:hypothetical protein